MALLDFQTLPLNRFQCGGSLFKVPYWLLEKYSPVLFCLTVSDANEARGTSDDTAVPIDDLVSRGEFVIFLDFFYRGFVPNNHKRWLRWLIPCPSFLQKKIPTTEWHKLLVISSKVGCKELRTKAIDELTARKTRVSSVDRIVLGNKHIVPQWLPEAYADLFVREGHLTVEEGEKLGLEIAVKVLKGRYTCKKNGWTSSVNAKVLALVNDMFPPPSTRGRGPF